MKKVCLKKLVTTFLFISLVVMHPCDISAKESASDDFESTFELSQSKDFADDIQIITASDEKTTIKTDVEKKTSIKDSIIQNRTDKVGETITKSNDRNDPVIYYGSYTGYLTGTNDYLLYPASLSAGQYLQVQLTLPDDNNIDYDLWLLDSSFSTIKTSDYYTVTTSTMTSTLPESLGYIASSAETVYVCVYSVGGGSTTDAYTLDYVIGENNYDSGEPDENTKELTGISFTNLNYTVNRTTCSPLDNDWYLFTVIDDPTYNKVRFTINSSSSTNGCSFEVYDNVVSGGYGMRRLAYGTDGETPLEPGTYYIRIISDNTFSNYDSTDIPTYTLSVLPVSRVDKIEIYNYLNEHYVSYNQGSHHRVEMYQNIQNHTGIRGRAYYEDPSGLQHPSINAKITCTITNESWMDLNQPTMATTHNSALTNNSGVFGMYINLNIGIGTNSYMGPMSWHKYDLMDLKLSYDSIEKNDIFYYLVESIPY